MPATGIAGDGIVISGSIAGANMPTFGMVASGTSGMVTSGTRSDGAGAVSDDMTGADTAGAGRPGAGTAHVGATPGTTGACTVSKGTDCADTTGSGTVGAGTICDGTVGGAVVSIDIAGNEAAAVNWFDTDVSVSGRGDGDEDSVSDSTGLSPQRRGGTIAGDVGLFVVRVDSVGNSNSRGLSLPHVDASCAAEDCDSRGLVLLCAGRGIADDALVESCAARLSACVADTGIVSGIRLLLTRLGGASVRGSWDEDGESDEDLLLPFDFPLPLELVAEASGGADDVDDARTSDGTDAIDESVSRGETESVASIGTLAARRKPKEFLL